MNEHLTIEQARTFADPDATYKSALNDPTVFEALCSDEETIRLLIDVFTMKVEHLQTQLDTRARRVGLELAEAHDERDAALISANHAEWEGKVKALLRSTHFHLKQALRRARLLWDDPIRTLKEVQHLIDSDMADADVLDAIEELIDKSVTDLER